MALNYGPENLNSVVLSTMHDDASIDTTTNKAEIIMDYNATKGGVDTINKLCATYSVSRITRRWPCAIFFSLLNITGINAQVLHMPGKPANTAPCRRMFLKNLSISLMKEHLRSHAKIQTLPSNISMSIMLLLMMKCQSNPHRNKEHVVCVSEKKRDHQHL
ncbi:uncharacterized protein LOC118204892 [Stegodyphus dumicola]|uniref:uncharacterized protein LOC118187614 n=1 Tax=Stegodyphus dumicola TaxID=202533 RepID=UPI0015AC822C|nr:uncharacterized protein LOC118187614 [Stegodyphus dumicola]XP_035233081.1 uncharacterized protein LOC118204892 [Stegodyphus dumicola]